MIGLTLLPLAVVFAAAATAHAAARPSVLRGGPAGGSRGAPLVVGHLPAAAGTGTRYLYAQYGTCPDGIDVYRTSGASVSFIQHVLLRSECSIETLAGEHHLAVVTTPASCLVFTDGWPDNPGYVYSFKIDASTGMIGPSPISHVSVRAGPDDLAVSGSTVYVSASPSSTIDVLTVNSGCGLKIDSVNSTGSEQDINIAVVNPTTVVSTNTDSYTVPGDVVAYSLQANKTLVETASDPGQILDPDGVAVLNAGGHAFVFTGQNDEGPPQTQGFAFTESGGFTPLPGSPQTSTDPGSDNALDAAVAVSLPNRLLTMGDQDSGQISWDTLSPGGGMAYGGDTSLAQDDTPTELTLLGNVLLVAQADSGDVEACAVAPSGVSNCRTILTTTGADGYANSGSLAVFSP